MTLACHSLSGLSQLSGTRNVSTQVSQSSKIAALAAETKRGRVLWLANLKVSKQTVSISSKSRRHSHTLSAATFASLSSPGFLASKGRGINNMRSIALPADAILRLTEI